MSDDFAQAAEAFLSPSRLYTRSEVLIRPCPVPAAPGVYGWWFRQLPADMDTASCRSADGQVLLYTGISPRRPSSNGVRPSGQTIRTRIRTHLSGNAEGSTPRKTLGCLLAKELGIELRRVGSGRRMTFLHGEQALSEWLAANVSVSWVVHPAPWKLEHYLINILDVPLNLEGNSRNRFHPELTAARAAAVARAKRLPIEPNPVRGGR